MTIINQCDGCNSKAPLANGNHLDGRGLPYMACQADRYRDAHAQPPSAVPTVPIGMSAAEWTPGPYLPSNETIALRAEVERLKAEAAMHLVQIADVARRGEDDYQTARARADAAEKALQVVAQENPTANLGHWEIDHDCVPHCARCILDRLHAASSDPVNADVHGAGHAGAKGPSGPTALGSVLTSEEQVERVARAIYQKDYEGSGGSKCDGITDKQRDIYRGLARAAIGAMG